MSDSLNTIDTIDTVLAPAVAEALASGKFLDPSPPPSVLSLPLNSDQLLAIESMASWWYDSYASPFFLLKGSAGTGKTTCIQTLIYKLISEASAAGDKPPKIVMTAPTNKATKVLREVAANSGISEASSIPCCTIYSLLGVTVAANGEIKEAVKTDDSFDRIESYDLVIVDEGSMVNSQIFALCGRASNEANVRFIFMGDHCQLPPVGEEFSQALLIDEHAKLEEVMRHKNGILDTATMLRQVIEADGLALVQIKENGEIIPRVKKAFDEEIAAYVAAPGYNPQTSKVIAWRNLTVMRYNEVIRRIVLGVEALREENFFINGELLVCCQPVELPGNIKFTTDEEVYCDSSELHRDHIYDVAYHKVFFTRKPPSYDTQNQTVFGYFRVVAASGQTTYRTTEERLRKAARANGRLWKDYWAFREYFHDVRHAYAITAHRSQGSTYEQVFVDAVDIRANQNKMEALRCLYVAITRAKNRAVIKIL